MKKLRKLFLADVGLIGCMTGLRHNVSDLFKEFKCVLTEQYVMQQIISSFNTYYYTNDRDSCEIDFVVDNGEIVVPVEVKAKINLKAKSLKTYSEKYDPQISVRTSMADYKKEDRRINIPLYAISEMSKILK